jgi:hypothetical protein
MEKATDTNRRSNQQVRFATPMNNNSTIDDTNISPITVAESTIQTSVASLRSELATIISKLGREHIVLLINLDSKKSILKKLNDNEDFIPRSARLAFQLSGSKRTEQRPEFIALAEETTIMVTTYRKALRDQVIKALTIEITTIEEETAEHLLKAIRIITKSIMITNKDKSDADSKVNVLMKSYLTTLSTYCPMTMPTFLELYKKIHGLEVFPPPPPTGISALVAQSDIIPDDVKKLEKIIKAIFVVPWTKYKKQQEINTVNLELKRLSAGFFTDRDTAVAVSVVDLEPAADKPELQALIRRETQAENKTLRKELNILKQQLAGLKQPPNAKAKNSITRGPGSGASTKTNTQNSHHIHSNQTNKNKNKNKNNPVKNQYNTNNKTSNKTNNKTRSTGSSGKKNTKGKQQQKGQNQRQQADGNNNDTGTDSKKRKANYGNNSSQLKQNSSSKRQKKSPSKSQNGQD